MAMAHVVNMTQSREVSIHRVEQPEARNIRRREIRKSGTALPPPSGQNAALRSKDLDEPPRDSHEVVVRGDIQQRRNVLWVQPKGARAGPLNARDLQRIAPFAGLSLNEEPQILPRNLHGFFRQTGIFVLQID